MTHDAPAELPVCLQIMSLSEEELARGVYACSSGNYALGVLHGCAAVQSAGR